MRQMFRRNTSPGPPPATKEPVTGGHGTPNSGEPVKRIPSSRYKPRDRVKVMAPPEFRHKTGYVVEPHDIINEHGLMEIELDHELDDATGFQKLSDINSARSRLTIKNPDRQLMSYRYMKCNGQHFELSSRADALAQISLIATYILCVELLSMIFIVKDGESNWNSHGLFVMYIISSSLSIGLGFYVVLMVSFICATIKRISGKNNLVQNGSVHDECTSYHWFKSTHWRPFWLCGRKKRPCLELICSQSAKLMLVFIITFMLSIILYITDQTAWYLGMLCIIFMALPLLMALHVILGRGMVSF